MKTMDRLFGAPTLLAALYLSTLAAHAQEVNAIWTGNVSEDWFNPLNWSPTGPPTETATFGPVISNRTALTFSAAPPGLGTFHFEADAPQYSFSIEPGTLELGVAGGTGIVNDSTTHRPEFTIVPEFGGLLFSHSATAADAVITNNALVNFVDTSTAGNATITTFTIPPMGFASGGTAFFNSSTAGNATLITDHFGATDFLDTSTAGNATIITNNGGLTRFFDESTGGQATFVTNAGGGVDISGLATAGITVGSIAGEGDYFLGSKNLTVGDNNTDTIVSGGIHDGSSPINNVQPGGTGGSLTKVGTGTLTLLGDNTYSGSTNVNGGTLLVNGSLGAGSVNVISGATLGGTGTIAGPVAIQNGGFLAPGDSPGTGTLTVRTLTLNSGSLLNYALGIPNVVGNGQNDLVNVNGNLTLAGKLNVINAGGFGSGAYRLFNYTGSLTNNGLSLNSLPNGFAPSQFLIQTALPGEVNLLVSSGGFTDQFWDGSVTVADGIIHGGSGTWNNTATNWTRADARVNAPWQNGFAIFAGTAGTVTLGDNIRFGGMQFMTNGYTITAPASQTLTAAPATIIRVDQGVSATISAPIVDGSSPSAITKTDLGTLILNGNNTYSGGTTIMGGTLQLGNGGASGSVLGDVIDNGTLAFDRTDSLIFNGAISGIGSLVQQGGGTFTLTGTNTYSGGTFVNAGTLVAAANSALGRGLVTVNNPSLLRIDPGVRISNFVQLNNGGRLDNAGTIQVTAVTEGPAAAAMTAGGATITNEAGATVSGVGLIAIQSLNGPAIIANSGSISGTQGILLRGGGTITNNVGGQVTGTGGTAVVIGGSQAKLSNAGPINGNVQLNASSNTAQLFTGGKISGNLALTPSGSNQVILDGSGTQLLSESVTGTISNAGALTKQGTGEWILDKNLSPPVSTLINSGILQVNSGDVLTSPTVTVGPGAELIGLGTIAGSVINSGIVSPGVQPGTLTVTGNYTQNSSGTLNIGFASGSHGLLAVGGQAFLGGTLRLSLLNGFVPPPAQRFPILTAGAGVNGTFSLVQQTAIATAFTVIYDPNDVTVVAGQVPFQNFACNPNTKSVLTALQSVRNTATGDLGVVIGVLNGLPTNQLCNAAGQISPLPVPSLPTQVINYLDNQSTELDQRLWFFEQPFDPQHPCDIYVNGSGIFGRIKNIFDLPALDFDTGTTTPGGEYRFSPSLGLGVYAGYAHSESRFSDGTHVSTDTPNGGTYGLWNPPFMGPFGVDFAFGAGYNAYSMKRPINFGDPINRVASSNPRSKFFKYRLGTSYHKKFGKLNVEVLGSYEYASIENDRFYENGAYSLDTRVGKYDVPSFRQRFGIHLVYDIPVTNKVTITPDCRLTWIHEYLDGTRTVPVSLDSGAGPNFSLSQPHGPRDEYISVVGFYAVFGELKGYLYWTSDFGSGIVTSNSIMGGATLNF
jgi:autotransporter-associated beta strand protein